MVRALALLFCLSGCGLILDTDPPDQDGDGGISMDGAFADGALVDGGPADGQIGDDGAVPVDGGRLDGVTPSDGGSDGDIPCSCPPVRGCLQVCNDDGECVDDDPDGDGMCTCEALNEGIHFYEGHAEEDGATFACTEGRTAYRCEGGEKVPETAYFPAEETCSDGIDLDCDGVSDEGFLDVECGAGSCTTFVGCTDGVESCYPMRPRILDSCNEMDDDCDGRVDEDCDEVVGCDHVINISEDNPRPLVQSALAIGGVLCLTTGRDDGRCESSSVTLSNAVDVVPAAGMVIRGDLYEERGQIFRCDDRERHFTTLQTSRRIRVDTEITVQDMAVIREGGTGVVLQSSGGILRLENVSVYSRGMDAAIAVNEGAQLEIDASLIQSATRAAIKADDSSVRIHASCSTPDIRGRCQMPGSLEVPSRGIFGGPVGTSAIQASGGVLEIDGSLVASSATNGIVAQTVTRLQILGSYIRHINPAGSIAHGVRVLGANSALIRESVVDPQSTALVTGNAMGISFVNTTTAIVEKTQVLGRTRGGSEVAGIYCQDSHCWIRDSLVTGRDLGVGSGTGAYGLYCQDSSCDVRGSTLTGNGAAVGYPANAAGIRANGPLNVSASILLGGAAATVSLGLWVRETDGTAPVVVQNTVAVGERTRPDVSMDVFSSKAVGAFFDRNQAPRLLHNTFVGLLSSSGINPIRVCEGAGFGGDLAWIISTVAFPGGCGAPRGLHVIDSTPIPWMSHSYIGGDIVHGSVAVAPADFEVYEHPIEGELGLVSTPAFDWPLIPGPGSALRAGHPASFTPLDVLGHARGVPPAAGAFE